MWGNREQLRESVRAAMASRALRHFMTYTNPAYLLGWVHRQICDELDQFLQDSVDGKSPRLMLCMPPRHGKSEIASRKFPAYALGRYPDLQFIVASYSASLANLMNHDVQRVINSEEYQRLFPDVHLGGGLTGYIRTSSLFEIVGRKGSYRSAGVDGGVTGMGAHIIIIDDPFKNKAEADSALIRAKTWDWYASTLYTRLAPGGGILLINTRWHTDDLSGRLIAEMEDAGKDQWRIINFPAIATHDEPHRKAGEALHPERYSLADLEKLRSAVGTRNWEALYQQNPVPDGGALFRERWLRYWHPSDLPDSFDRMVTSWDLTFKNHESGDYVAGSVWGKKDGNFYLLDMVHERLGFTETLDAVRHLHEKYPKSSKILIEDAANGPAVIDMLKKTVPGIVPVRADGSKEARAHAVTPYFESGNVYIPHPSVAGPWVGDFVQELISFPLGAHDDMVDSTTQALRSFMNTGRLITPKLPTFNTPRTVMSRGRFVRW